MKNNLMKLAAAGLFGLAAGSLMADTAPAASKWYDTMKFDGFVESYYKYNPNALGLATTDHVFDLQQNTFALGGGRIGMKSADGFATVDLYFGDYATVLQTGVLTYANGTAIEIGQAFVVQALGPVNLTLGRYMTHVGYEVIDSVGNQNFTRSLLYFNEPFYHTGAKLNYSINGVGLMVQADDGNSVNSSPTTFTGFTGTVNHYVAGGAQISYTGVTGLGLFFNYYYQPFPSDDPTNLGNPLWNSNHFLNFVVTCNIMEGLDVGGEFLYINQIYSKAADSAGNILLGSVPDPKQQGYALYSSYVIPGTDGLKVSPRFEAWYTPDNSPANTATFDYTLTLKYAMGPVTNWLEFREDASDSMNVYPPSTGSSPVVQNTEMALTYGLTYSY